MNTRGLLKLYLFTAASYLLLLLLAEDWAWLTKSLLLPSIVAAVNNAGWFATRRLLTWALLLSWFGDVTLMFAQRSEWFFIMGLVLFLAAHLLYILVFARQAKMRRGNRAMIVGAPFVLIYLGTMLYSLYPSLGSLKIPVTVYAVVISTMLLMAINGLDSWCGRERYIIFAGAVCFVLSDSLLAFDKFHTPIPWASFGIMSTYLAAQYLIASGILMINKKQQTQRPAAD